MWGPGPVVTLCLFEVKVQVQNGSSHLSVALSELVMGREILLPAKENSPLNCLSLSLVKKKYPMEREVSLRTKIRPRPLIVMAPLRVRSLSDTMSCANCAVYGCWGDCQLIFFGKYNIQVSTLLNNEKTILILSSDNFWSTYIYDFDAFYNFNSIFTNIVNFFSSGLNILSFFNNYSDKATSRTFALVSPPPHLLQACRSHLKYM